MRRVTLASDDIAHFSMRGAHLRELIPPAGCAPIWPHAGEDGRVHWPKGEDALQGRVYTIRQLRPASREFDLDVDWAAAGEEISGWPAASTVPPRRSAPFCAMSASSPRKATSLPPIGATAITRARTRGFKAGRVKKPGPLRREIVARPQLAPQARAMTEPPAPDAPDPPPAAIDAVFRNGSLTAISVVAGFSLTFLNRWAAIPGTWLPIDLVAVAAIVCGIVLQVSSLAILLWPRSLELKVYGRAIRLFLAGLGFVAIGVACAIGADLGGAGQRVLGG